MEHYYSPRLDRDLITALYHEAKARGIPMTQLASRLIRAALRCEWTFVSSDHLGQHFFLPKKPSDHVG